MLIQRPIFYDSIRQSIFSGKISDKQVQGIEAILNEFEKQQLTDYRWLSYMLATAYHETGHTMQPIEEYGKGKGHKYGQKIKRSGVPYTTPDKIYYGRGDVQLTWYENYEQMGRLLGIDLLNHPELALQMDVAVKIMFEGMMKGNSHFGDFTGKCLEEYFNDATDDPINARKIINGLDCAEKIAGYHHHFLDGIKAATVLSS